jgi:hypothetical protein
LNLPIVLLELASGYAARVLYDYVRDRLRKRPTDWRGELEATPLRLHKAPNDGLSVIEYHQDANSFGWSVVALIVASVTGPWGKERWGVLTALVGTDVGMVGGRSRQDVVRDSWHIVDWYGSMADAHQAYDEVKSRTR